MIRLLSIAGCLLCTLSLGCGRPVSAPPTILDARAATPVADRTEERPGEEKEPEQSYEEAWQIICNAEALSQVDPALPRAEYNAKVVSWLVAHLKNKKARYWFLELDQNEVQHRAKLFAAEAQRAGVQDCKLTGLLFPEDGVAGGEEPPLDLLDPLDP